MRTQTLLLALAVCVAPFSRGVGQTAPTCAAAGRIRVLPGSRPPQAEPPLHHLADSLVASWPLWQYDRTWPFAANVDAAWKADSTRLIGALALIIQYESIYGTAAADVASEAYQRLWGRTEPLLAASPGDWNPVRIYTYLTALQPPLAPKAQDVVLSYACDAVWLLRAVKQDATYYTAWSDGNAILWPRALVSVIDVAGSLLSGSHRDALLAAITGLEDMLYWP